jgi:hypothetical protein
VLFDAKRASLARAMLMRSVVEAGVGVTRWAPPRDLPPPQSLKLVLVFLVGHLPGAPCMHSS